MNTIVINDVSINIEGYEEVNNENGEIKELSFGFSVNGRNEYYLMKKLFSEKIKVFLPEKEMEIYTRIVTSSSQYKDELTDNTPVNFRYTLSTVDENESNDTLQERTIKQLFEAQLKIRTLSDLLIEKEIVTKEELESKFQCVIQRDGNKIVEELTGVSLEEATEETE